MHRITKFNQKAKLKPYIDMKTKSRMQSKMIIKKTSLSQWIIECLEKQRRTFKSIETLDL